MTKLANLGVRARREYIAWLDAYLKQIGFTGSRADFVLESLNKQLEQRGAANIPSAKAPHGVRSDALPMGWKSRLYPDRYQIVARYTAKGFELRHLHECEWDLSDLFGELRADEVLPGDGLKVEVYIIDAPRDANREIVAQSLRLELSEWLNT